MPPRVTPQAFLRPVPRLLVEHLRPTPRSQAWLLPASSRALSRLSRAPSICLRCSVQSQLRRWSTSPRPPDLTPKKPESDAIPLPPPPPPSSLPSSSSSSSAEPSSSEQPATEQPSTDSQQTQSQHGSDPDTNSNNHNHNPSLPSNLESARSTVQARFSQAMDNLQSRLLTASQTLNDITGYSSIESIKHTNARLESDLLAAQTRLKAARHDYKSLTNHRASTQREVTTLLARKDTWSPADLERFTTLYRSDHELEATVAGAAAELTEAESEESRLGAALNAGILRRYHEEQIWSDRIRRASTWGTWGLMGFNLFMFVVLQFFAEPWKRRRLVRGFAEAESGVWDEVRREVGEVRGLLMEVKEGRAADAVFAAAAQEQEELERVAEDAATAQASLAVEGEAQAEDVVVPPAEGETPAEVEVTEPVVGVTETDIPAVAQPAASWDWEEWKEAVLDPDWWKTVLDPARWRMRLEDLYSDRRIDLRMRDASIIALEGAATGAAIAAGVVFVLLRRS